MIYLNHISPENIVHLITTTNSSSCLYQAFKYFTHISVDRLTHLFTPVLVFIFCLFAAFNFYVINSFISVVVQSSLSYSVCYHFLPLHILFLWYCFIQLLKGDTTSILMIPFLCIFL